MENVKNNAQEEKFEELTDKEAEFISSTVFKELFFHFVEGEKTSFTNEISKLVEVELSKIENGDCESENPEDDIQTAKTILEKFKKLS